MPQVLKILLQVQQTLEAVSLLSWQRPNFQMCISGANIVCISNSLFLLAEPVCLINIGRAILRIEKVMSCILTANLLLLLYTSIDPRLTAFS